MHSKAYIFRHQQLLVDEHFQLPQVEKLQHDLDLSENGQVIARDLKENESVPEGYQLVPIRQLVQVWSRPQFEQSYWSGVVTTASAANVAMLPSSMSASMP